MNVNDGHLIANIDYIKECKQSAYNQLHGAQNDEATVELNGKREAFVDLSQPHGLSQYARNQRRKKKRQTQKQRMKGTPIFLGTADQIFGKGSQ